MAGNFIGLPNIEHVAQPPDSELCFAAIMSAISGHSIDEAQLALLAAELSAEDGSTTPMGEASLKIVDSLVTITPFQSPFEGAQDSAGVLGLMDEQFQAGNAVTLLHKKNDAPDDERHHWTAFTGYSALAGKDAPLRIIDPLATKATYIRRPLVAQMVDRSLDYMGVYGYALGQGGAA